MNRNNFFVEKRLSKNNPNTRPTITLPTIVKPKFETMFILDISLPMFVLFAFILSPHFGL
ncbi:MAG: hypothetical protein ACK4R7_00040 [Fervidobacterium sp.]